MIISPLNLLYFFLILLIFVFVIQDWLFNKLKNIFNPTIKNIIEKFEEKLGLIEVTILFIGAPVTFLLYVFLFPNVYIVDNCNSYSKKVLIFSTTVNNQKLEYGRNHSYLINESNSTIKINTLIYNSSRYSTKRETKKEQFYNMTMENRKKYIEKELYPKDIVEVKNNEIHYFFEEPPISVIVNNRGILRYRVECLN